MGKKIDVQRDVELSDAKTKGQIYTPDYLVSIILDQSGYTIGNISKHHIMENSCGNGQFLVQIVDRYCKDFLYNSSDKDILASELETYIHAIEIDNDELLVCRERCSLIAESYGIARNIRWDFISGNSLNIKDFDGRMDYVIGNPPYVRIHNLSDNFDAVKSSLFGNSGMTDLFIAFYEIGIRMLNKNGTLCYITPSSFFTSIAGSNMRTFLVDNEMIKSVCDLKHFQPFDAITYTTIICLKNGVPTDKIDYYEFDENRLKPIFIEKLEISDFYINGLFYFSSKEKLLFLKKIFFSMLTADIKVKNGYATLADNVFVGDFLFGSKYIIPVVKASRGQLSKIIFPYDKNGKLISEEVLKNETDLYSYLTENKNRLKKRSNENSSDDYWFAFGRSQGINDTFTDKIAISSLIRNSFDLKTTFAPAGTGVYGGLYVVSGSIPMEKICSVLKNEEFGNYISLLGKYKSGGYYTFSSKDVKRYLDYKLGVESGG